jgi:hypothetical protein
MRPQPAREARSALAAASLGHYSRRPGELAWSPASVPPVRGCPLTPMGSTFDTVRDLARALPGVEGGGSAGAPALTLKGKLLAWLREDPEVLAVKVSPVNREYLLKAEPAIFFVTEHYREYPIVLVRLPRIGRRRLAEVLEEAWRQVAPKRMRSAYDAQCKSGTGRPGA